MRALVTKKVDCWYIGSILLMTISVVGFGVKLWHGYAAGQ
jgi:hypothetical protein